MAKKGKGAVNADNRATVNIGGWEFEVEASLGAGIIYQNEFRGKAEKPYTGSLYEDMVQLYRETEDADSPNYYGFSSQLMGITWAMARAAGGIGETYAEFLEKIEHSSVSIFEFADLYGTVVKELGDRCFFRLPEGLRDALEANGGEAGGGVPAPGGDGDMGGRSEGAGAD